MSYDNSVEALAKEFYSVIHKPSIVAKLLIQNPNILMYQDSFKGNALQAAMRTTVANESSALTILNYAESHSMINSYEDNINLCPFYLAILKGYFNCLSIMVNTKQGKYILDKYPSLVLIAAINSGNIKMINKVLQYPQVTRIVNVPYNNEGDTYLHLAVMKKDTNLSKSKTIDIVRALVSNGADATLTNNQGKRPSMLSKNEQVWNYLRECEVEMEDEYKQNLNETIHELAQQNDSRESLISKLVNESKTKEHSFTEKLREVEASTEAIKGQMLDEIKDRDMLIEQLRNEVHSLMKEKESLLKSLHSKSEEHVAHLLKLQQQHTTEKEVMQKELTDMSRMVAILTDGFQQIRTNMIGLQNDALKGFQAQQITRFNNIQQNIELLQQNQSLQEETHVNLEEKINILQETTDNNIVILRKENKANREQLLQLQQDLATSFETSEVRHINDVTKIKEHFGEQIGSLTNVIETNRNLTEQRILINEDRIASNSLEIETTNTRLADHTKRQQLDKQKIYEEIEKDREVQRQLLDVTATHTTEIQHLNETTERLTETTQDMKEDILDKKKEDKRKFDTLFERVENSEYFQSEKIHEVVIEKMMQEKKRQLEQLENTLMSNQHFSQ